MSRRFASVVTLLGWLLVGLPCAVASVEVGAAAEAEVQLGPRPFWLVGQMRDGPLRERLAACRGPFAPSDFSIGHRGAPLQFPEHTRESYEAAALMGAGLMECDVTFTRDRQLVCRHAQCDLHTTTDILTIPELAAKCSEPFRPADPVTGAPASARCCASDLTLPEFRRLKGKMDGFNPQAQTPEEYLGGTPSWRTDLYSPGGELLSHADSIELFRRLGVRFIPELKAPEVPMPFEGTYTREQYARQLVAEYEAAGVHPGDVWLQSFELEDVLYWIEHTPQFGRQAVFLDARVDTPEGFDAAVVSLPDLAARGVRIVAPPLWALLSLDEEGRIVPSRYARAARAAGLQIMTWTVERSGLLQDAAGPPPTWYYQSVAPVIAREGDVFEVLDVLAHDVGVIGVFSDWPATTTFFANCLTPD